MKRYFYITPNDIKTAEQNGISYGTLKMRVRGLCWDVDRAISEKVNAVSTIPKEIRQRAAENGISADTLQKRINSLGWDMERACTEKVQSRKETLEKAQAKLRKYPRELVALAESNGISAKNFRLRCRRGWDMYEAATTPLMSTSESLKKANEVNKRKPFVFGSKLHSK